MKCNIVKDLMPLYLDDLCSEETKQELENHMKECEECKKIKDELEQPEQPSETQAEDLNKSIAPLKKVKKKMKKKNRLIAVCVVFLVIVLGATGWLTYGQLTGETMSFEMAFDLMKLNKAGKEFAKGNIDPLYDMLYDGYVVQDPESAVLSIEYEDDITYDADMKDAIMEKYKYYFTDHKLSYEGIEEVGYWETPGTGWNKRPYVSMKFVAGENFEYHIFMYKAYPDSYLAKDYFGNPYITYNSYGEMEEAEAMADDFFQTSDTLFASMPNKLQDISLSVIRKVTIVVGKRAMEGDTLLAESIPLRLDVLSQKDLENNTRTLQDMANEKLIKMAEHGYYVMDITWNVKAYDTENYLYRYNVDIEMQSKDAGSDFIISFDCYRISEAVFVMIPETEKVYGNEIPDEIVTILDAGLFTE